MVLDGRAQPTGIKRRGSDATLLLVFNAHHDIVTVRLPEVPEGRRWIGLVDTYDPARNDPVAFGFGHRYAVTSRSLLLFVLDTEDGQMRRVREIVGSLLEVDASIVPVAGAGFGAS
jgi:glycogen operon protein